MHYAIFSGNYQSAKQGHADAAVWLRHGRTEHAPSDGVLDESRWVAFPHSALGEAAERNPGRRVRRVPILLACGVSLSPEGEHKDQMADTPDLHPSSDHEVEGGGRDLPRAKGSGSNAYVRF